MSNVTGRIPMIRGHYHLGCRQKVVGFQLSAKNTTTICFKKPFNYLHIRYLQPWVLPPHQKEAVQGNTEMSIFNIQFSIFNIQGDTETLI